MNTSSISNFSAARKQEFKGKEETIEKDTAYHPVEKPKDCEEKLDYNTAALIDAINKNTNALGKIVNQIYTNTSTLYAIEKSKTSTNGFHDKSYSQTSDPVDFVNYVNSHWESPSHNFY